MITYLTLADAVRASNGKFETALSHAIHSGLLALGDRIYHLEWANVNKKSDLLHTQIEHIPKRKCA